MTREVFKNVYALTQNEALGLERRAWQHVQDRVLGGSSYDFLRPSREVVSALDTERRRLWRPDRRGRPEAREIAARLGVCGTAFARLASVVRRLKRLTSVCGNAAKLNDNNGELQRIELALERDATLAPLVRRAERMTN